MATDRPNVLFIMTDEERYPPPYEDAALTEFRRTQLPARERLRDRSIELHRHYTGSTACLPSRATLFTGQYPSLHGVTDTDALAKKQRDPAMKWLDPGTVPTMGDWFRAAGYSTHYRGKWHVSHADLPIPGIGGNLGTNDSDGIVDPVALDRYRRADRLDPFGFSGWVGREPHGAAKADCGVIRDPLYANQVTELFGQLVDVRDEGPWLTVASFVNPHDIAFTGFGWEQILGFGPPDPSVPDIPAAPSQADSLDRRPTAQAQFRAAWPTVLYPQDADNAYRRLYHHLIKLVDGAIMKVLDELEASGMADDTIVMFTSDHGDLLGAHGGLMQKWHNAYDEAVRVPLLVSGPGIDTSAGFGEQLATSHVDLIPTLLGLVGADIEKATAGVSAHHSEPQPLPGRDLSPLLRGQAPSTTLDAPIYFMTEDEVTRGSTQRNLFTNDDYDCVAEPAKVESIITHLPTGPDGARELWKLNHYYDRLDEWNAAQGLAVNPFAPPAAQDQWEVHNLSADPEERTDLAAASDTPINELRTLLDTERDNKRLLPTVRTPA